MQWLAPSFSLLRHVSFCNFRYFSQVSRRLSRLESPLFLTVLQSSHASCNFFIHDFGTRISGSHTTCIRSGRIQIEIAQVAFTCSYRSWTLEHFNCFSTVVVSTSGTKSGWNSTYTRTYSRVNVIYSFGDFVIDLRDRCRWLDLRCMVLLFPAWQSHIDHCHTELALLPNVLPNTSIYN
jgi:hypothetical protein